MEKIYIGLGRRIQKVRKQCGMSQRELAGRINIPRTTLANYETGRKRIPLHHLQSLEQVLKHNLYLHLDQHPAPADMEAKLASLAGLLADATYLPALPRTSFEGWRGMDLTGRRLLPFPQIAAREADYVIAAGSQDSMNLYLIKTAGIPEPENLVCVESREVEESGKEETHYSIEPFSCFLEAHALKKRFGTQKRIMRVVGVVTAVMQTGTFRPLATVEYLSLDSTG